eukprot:14580395-Alexandrium_andersonii.AAC.1
MPFAAPAGKVEGSLSRLVGAYFQGRLVALESRQLLRCPAPPGCWCSFPTASASFIYIYQLLLLPALPSAWRLRGCSPA